MAFSGVTKLINALVEQTIVQDSDYMIIGGADAKKIKWTNIVAKIKDTIMSDSGWLTLPLSSGVTPASGEAQYRKVGNTVEVRAIVSSTSALGGSYTEVTLATLPDGYRPSQMIAELQHASNYHIYQVRINTNGTITASRARTTYTAGAHADIPAGGLIYIHTTFLSD